MHARDLDGGKLQTYNPITTSLKSILQEVVRKKLLKLLDSGIIYPISENVWVGPIQVVPKKRGITVIKYDNNELIPARTTIG